MSKRLLSLAILAGLFFCQGLPPVAAQAIKPMKVQGYNLDFAKVPYQKKTATVQGKELAYRAYEGIVYVKHPVDLTYETMNIYIPDNYFSKQKQGIYDAATAPIFFPNTVGGYMPGEAGRPEIDNRTGKENAALIALSRGLVVAEPGARGRTNKDIDGSYTGKAPAAIVDLKAAVRYLRLNDEKMPGNAERIISNGTSAGGALSALLAASGNNKDYEPYLAALGAARTRDDIYAASVYCPITNLDNADKAYEWYFAGVYDYTRHGLPGMMPSPGSRLPLLPKNFTPKVLTGTMTAEQIKLSKALAAKFPSYVNILGMTSKGEPLVLDSTGDGTFKDYVKSFIIASAQKAIDKGQDLSQFTWLKTIENGKKAIGLDFPGYVQYVRRMKTTPDFDGVDLKNGENEEFGSYTTKARHFTDFSFKHSMVKGSLAEEQVIKMMNPMPYLEAEGTQRARFWRIRHGAIDSDTALVIPLILATKLSNLGYNVDFAVPWGQGHGGDYDLTELFQWIEKIVPSTPKK